MRPSPYPPAEEARVYEELCPGAFERMLAMTEKIIDSQIAKSRQIIHHQINMDKRLAWLGWVALLALIILLIEAAILCSLKGHDWVAAALGISSSMPVLAGVIDRFIPDHDENSP